MSIESSIQQLYVAYFNRPADTAGLNYWTAVVTAAGGSTAAVSTEFSKSAEYKAAYAGLSNTLIVDTVYMNLFGRHAEAGGLQYWTLLLDQGAISIANVVTQIAAGAQGTDATAYNNKTLASMDFTRGLDTGAEIRGYDGTGPNGPAVLALAKAYVTGVTDDASLATARAGLDATITAVQVAHEVVAPVTLALTTGIDNIAPSAAQPMTGNDTINAFGTSLGQTLTSFDKLDLGDGTDTLNVVSVGQPFSNSGTSGVVIKNIEHAVVTSDQNVVLNTTGWTGLQDVIVTATSASKGATTVTADSTTAVSVTNTNAGGWATTVNGGSTVTVNATDASGGGTITVGNTKAPAGAITITSNNTSNHTTTGPINVTGGTTVSITQAQFNTTVGVGNENTNGAVTVTGGASTTSVTVNNAAAVTATKAVAGVIVNTVNIADVNGAVDAAGKLTTVNVSNFASLGVQSNALTSLTVAGGDGNIIIDNSGLTTPTNKALALSINGQLKGTLDDADIYTTLNITTTGANSTLSNITTGGLTGLTVAGTKVLTLTSTAGMGALKSVTVSGSAGLTASTLVAANNSSLTSIDASATSGAVTVSITGTQTTYTGGSGVDKVSLSTAGNIASTKAVSLGAGDDSLDLGTINAAPTGKLDGGAGTDNITMTAALAATSSADAKFAGVVTNFEKLTLTSPGSETIKLDVLGSFNHVTTSGSTNLTLQNLPNGGTLVLTGTGGAYVLDSAVFVTGANDTVNLSMTSSSAAAVTFSTGITATGVENFVITTADTQSTATNPEHLATIAGNSVKSITVSGNAGLNLTAASTVLATVDASGISKGAFDFTAGAAATVVKGGAAGANTVILAAASKGVAYTGGTGVDTITANTTGSTIDLGSGTTKNVVTGGATGNHTVTSTATDTVDGDAVTLGAGNNIVNLGNGKNAFTATTGNNTYVGGTGVDTVTVGGGSNTITLGTGADLVILNAASANVNTYSTITDAHAGVQITFNNLGTEVFNTTKVTLAATAVFQDYANAVVQAGGNASVDGKGGWFQFNGDTYIVQSRHDGSGTNASFVNGVDMIVKLTGLVDLAGVTGGTTNVLTLV